jgi:hypothetical protein
MPYEKRKVGDEWCVFNKETGDNKGCSATEAEADKHIAAMYANEAKSAMAECSMFITKAVSADGKMIWNAVASDTGKDGYDQRMTMALFHDFIARIEARDPAPVQLRSSYWDGGMPYVSIAHYLDHDGKSSAGKATSVFIDGDKFKAKGLLESEDPRVAEAVFRAIQQDIADKVPDDKRVRISTAFVDWQHKHRDGTVFVRQSLADICPVCASLGKIAAIGEFQKGQLMQLAVTRVPVNARTEIEAGLVEERSTGGKKADAASIVGEDLANEIDAREQEAWVSKSGAIVVKSDDAGEVAAAVTTRSDLPYGGATTLAQALDFTKAQNIRWQLSDLYMVLEGVLYNIIEVGADLVASKSAAMKEAISDFRGELETIAVAKLSLASDPIQVKSEGQMSEAVITHPLDANFTALRAKYDEVVANAGLTRTQKFEALQPLVNELGNVIARSVEASSPMGVGDIQGLVRDAVSEAMKPLLAALAGSQAQRSVAASSVPAARQVDPLQAVQAASSAQTGMATNIGQTKSIKAVVRRSMGLPEGGGA